MKRKTLVRIHLVATMIAAATIATFFCSSLAAEINGDELLIRTVKKGIVLSLPILVIAMPTLGITGNKLAGSSQNPIVFLKKRRMKLVLINGIMLIALACFLFYRSHFRAIDSIFMVAQAVEFILGLTNLVLIGLNIAGGLKLSGGPKST